MNKPGAGKFGGDSTILGAVLRVPRRIGMKVPDALRPTLRAALLLLFVFVVGTIGYAFIGGGERSWLDAVYMTTITLTTVGYQEAIAVSGRPWAQVFTIVLLLTGAGTFVYFFSHLTAFLVEGTLERLFWRRRMAREIGRLEELFIVCGAGKTGEHIVQELIQTRRPFVLVDQDEGRVHELHKRYGVEFPSVVGDATEDEILVAAGLERARGLIACVSSDKDNILVTFTARNLNPHVRIVARCSDPRIEAKLKRAGADAVVSPDRIGGLRLVSEMVRPTAVSFLDLMLRDSGRRWRVEEITVHRGSRLDGATAGSLRRPGMGGLTVLAVRAADGNWIYDLNDELQLESGMGIIFMGSPETRVSLERDAAAPIG